MKMFLLVPIMLTLLSFGESSHFSSSFPNPSDPMAVICNDSSEGTIQKSDLVKCDRLKIIASKTHEAMSYQIASYEVIVIKKEGDYFLEENAGASFNNPVKTLIQKLQTGDQIIFRKIKAKGEDNRILSMNSIPLKIQ